MLDLTARTGESWIRADLDPVPLDYEAPAGVRPAPRDGWLRYQLNTNRDLVVPSTGERLPAEFVDVGVLRYGRWDPRDAGLRQPGAVVRRRPGRRACGCRGRSPASPTRRRRRCWCRAAAEPTTVPAAGVGLVMSRDGADRYAGLVTWQNWQRVGYAERLKTGAVRVRDVMVLTAARGERSA